MNNYKYTKVKQNLLILEKIITYIERKNAFSENNEYVDLLDDLNIFFEKFELVLDEIKGYLVENDDKKINRELLNYIDMIFDLM
jgi:hypothetical protein